MALSAQYVDGKLVTDVSAQSKSKTGVAANGMDKDAFLQLLVAQMKYQDPLEPTSNTEYVSQYATFSELEEMQNMSSSMELSRASGLVGKTILVSSTNATTGKTTQTTGVVDFVTYEAGKAYVSIGGSLFSVDDIQDVLDDEYVKGVDTIKKMKEIMKKLPAAENITLENATEVVSLYNSYQGMSDYQKSLIDKTTKETIEKYVNGIADILDAIEKEQQNKAEGSGEGEGEGNNEGNQKNDPNTP